MRIPRPGADLIQLEQIASGYTSRERFLTELTLDPPDATSDQAGVPLLDEDYLILSTIHSGKGQEWKSVYVLSVVDGCIPGAGGAQHRPRHRTHCNRQVAIRPPRCAGGRRPLA
jgi:DNA helicase-2/ATP-dependent DNA helicase PcrA